MKKLAVVITILLSSIINNSYAEGGFNIHQKLKKAIKFENSNLPIEKNKPEFVKVSFKINKEGKIQVLETNYSDEIIKSRLMEKLCDLTVEEKHNPEEVYHYNFVFQKL